MNIIVAVDDNGGFAKNGTIPWYFKCDFAYFKKMTDGKICVMGKNTYLDMLKIFKERGKEIGENILPNRKCYVVSSTLTESPGATLVVGLKTVTDIHGLNDIFICGGRLLYQEALDIGADHIYMTVINKNYDCDTFFPVEDVEDKYKIISGTRETENDTELMFVEYIKTKGE